jgi:hypothetical protein
VLPSRNVGAFLKALGHPRPRAKKATKCIPKNPNGAYMGLFAYIPSRSFFKGGIFSFGKFSQWGAATSFKGTPSFGKGQKTSVSAPKVLDFIKGKGWNLALYRAYRKDR